MRYPVTAPPCRAAQLRMRNGRTGAGLGNYLEELVVTNTGASACLLRGYPQITAVNDRGERVALHPLRGGTYFGRLLPSDIRPGGRVFLDLATSRGCEAGLAPEVRYHALRLSLPGGMIPGEASIVVACGLGMSEFGLPERYAQPRSAPGSPGRLLARIVLPAAARRGRLLHYTVVLHNPTARTVTLQPCPGYTQGLFAQSATVRGTLRLNCRPVRTIAPHARVRFAMQLHVPVAARGLAKIGWSLDTPTGPYAGGAVRVR